MQNLLDFLARHFHWLVFLLLETASGILLFSYNTYQGSSWISTANLVTGKTLELQADVEQFFSFKRLNEELSQRNLVLEQQLAIYREQLASDGTAGPTDFSLLTADSNSVGSTLTASKTIHAKVISNSIDRLDNLITIDRGLADGVRPDMGVVSGTGLVGVVYMASEHYAIVLPILNSHSRISCSIRGRNYFGYLTWSGGNPVEAFVEDVPRHARFQKGEWVETSGYSAIFPRGVAVGKIIATYNSRDGLSYSLKVHLSTDFACLRDVYVINDERLPEQRHLMDNARDSLEMN